MTDLLTTTDKNKALVRSYTWGLDLSGMAQGAGGVGGLLMVNAGSGGVHFPAYDLNGNVMGLVNATNGIISAKYEYGPFGEVFCSVGDMAKVNPFQFSTKYTDNETDLVYYGYRYYSPALGRWLSRDPIEEQGGLNLYAFVNNDPVNRWDKLGLIRDTDLYYKSLKTDRCYFSYNFGVNDGMREKIGDWINGPGETKWLGTLNEVEEDIDQQMRQRNCCCIPLIYFTQHSGVPGMLVLESSKVIMSPTISKIQDMKLEEKKRKLLEESIRRETLFLKFVSKKMCKGGKVVFVECMSGAGEEGKILKDWLNDQFGNNVSITLFETNVKWCWGWTWGKEREN